MIMEREDEFMNWEVDKPALAKIDTVFGLRLFMHLWETTNEQSLTTEVELPDSLVSKVGRQTVWRAFTRLEELGLIRRPGAARAWSTIYLNPAVVHPHWMKGQPLTDRINAFNHKPSAPSCPEPKVP